ncbi:MAG TPA: hypothetical protein VHD76_08610 [Bryobacteraceae bacterium]|nr:hypothetical protein [Bryobacteraceae bacterium]
MTVRTINRISVAVLIAGLGAALAIFLTARPPEIDPMLGEPLSNKKYVHELKRMGGQANVLAAEFEDWFADQWQGRLLARSIAVLTIAGVIGFRVVAPHAGTIAAAMANPDPPPPAK